MKSKKNYFVTFQLLVSVYCSSLSAQIQNGVFKLINADTDIEVLTITGDVSWDLNNANGLNLIAEPTIGVTHVKFTLSNGHSRQEGTAPYAAYGDVGGDYGNISGNPTYYGWYPAVGDLDFTVEYLNSGTVTATDTFTITFVDSIADTQAPTTPSNPSSFNITATTVSIDWDASTDNLGVTGYNIYNGGNLMEANVSLPPLNVTGLTASTTYGFTITALDAAGNESPPSSAMQVTTNNLSDFGNNVALGKLVEQSSNYGNFYADNSVDGDTNTYTHTQSELNAWLKVDLGAVYNINTIVVYNRVTTNTFVANRLDGVKIGTSLVDSSDPSTYTDLGISLTSEYEHVFQNLSFNARYIIIHHPQEEFLSVSELEVYGANPSDDGTTAQSPWSESGSDIYYSDGNVGIGTTIIPSGYKLSVNGKILTEELKVQLQSAWPDYVFKKDYKLPTLEEIEKHIQEKGHLPNMPSAKQVEANGLEVGEINRLLLEKIEEQMLYILQQQAELKLQQEKNQGLEKRLSKLESKMAQNIEKL